MMPGTPHPGKPGVELTNVMDRSIAEKRKF